MSAECTIEIAKQVAVLAERMKTMQAEYKTDIARLAEMHAVEMAKQREDAAKQREDTAKQIASLREDAAKRETYLIVTLLIAIGLATTIIGTMIVAVD